LDWKAASWRRFAAWQVGKLALKSSSYADTKPEREMLYRAAVVSQPCDRKNSQRRGEGGGTQLGEEINSRYIDPWVGIDGGGLLQNPRRTGAATG